MLIKKITNKVRNVHHRIVRSWYWILTRYIYKAEPLPCVLCNENDFEELFNQNRFNFPFITAKCRNCGMGMQQPFPTKEFLNHFYTKRYHHGLYWGTLVQPTDDRKKRHVYLGARARMLDKKLSLKNKEVLDYGSGTGVFIEETRPYEANVTGADIGDTLKISYDLIVSVHVLEHLYDPLETLRFLKKHLKPGGHIFIEVPDTDIRMKKKYFHIQHVTYFTQKTLRRILEDAGYTVVDEGKLEDCKSIYVLAT